MSQKKRTRAYDSGKRIKQAELNRSRIVDLAIQLLKKQGAEFSLRKLSVAAKCSERHLYRIFGGVEGLAHELNSKMNEIIGQTTGFAGLSLQALSEFAARLHVGFNEHEVLVRAYLESPFGQISRETWLKEKDKGIRSALASDGIQEVLYKEILVLLSASFWLILRDEAGMSAAESVSQVRRMADDIVRRSERKS